jgi:release factor glutamine methyltransferase
MTSITEAVRAGAARLRAAGIDTPDLDAEVLMRHLLGIDRARYFLERQSELDPTLAAAFQTRIERRETGESVAYITGEREFFGRVFQVGPGALVPRPETELLVEWAIHWLNRRHRPARVADVGTGSGAIALSICLDAAPGAIDEMMAVDLSERALDWAKLNYAQLGSGGVPVRFVQGNLLDPVDGTLDLVLANLPYLTPEQVDGNRELATEPRDALVSGTDGLDLIRELLNDFDRVLARDGAAILEIDPAQAEGLLRDVTARFPEARVAVDPDLSGRARFLRIDRAIVG